MTPAEAEDLAARTLAAIDARQRQYPADIPMGTYTADRERVASDLAMLRECDRGRDEGWMSLQAWSRIRPEFADNLRRTAALYGVAP